MARKNIIPSKQPVKKKNIPPPSEGAQIALTLLGIGYILTSMTQMTALGNYEHYHYLFQQYSDAAIQARFCTSLIVRIMGLILGIGLLCKKEIFRKMGMGLAAGTAAVAYWKHPYEAYARHIQFLDERMSSNMAASIFSPKNAAELINTISPSSFSENDFTHLCVYCIVAWEIFCAFVVLFVLTRPKVKALFIKPV